MSGDAASIGNAVVLGIIVVLLIVTIVALTAGDKLNPGWANLLIIISFLVVVIVVAIPFLEINVQLAGTTDTRTVVQDEIKKAIGFTTAIFIAFLIITFMILRKYPTRITTFVNIFTGLAFFMSLITITIFSLQKI